MRRIIHGSIVLLFVLSVLGCDSDTVVRGAGGNSSVGGSQNGGTQNQAGVISSGGSFSTGGRTTSGGTVATGGNRAGGGVGGEGRTGGAMSAGGSVTMGGKITLGGTLSTGGSVTMGGKITLGGTLSTGGSVTMGGNITLGGTLGGTLSTGGALGTGGSTLPPGACEPGSTSTTWATACPTAPPSTCTAGTWVAGGPDPDHAGYKLLSESEHFAVYSDQSPTGAQAAVDYLETVWKTYFGSPMFMREPLCNSATKRKASIHVHSDWGLTGGSWAQGRMGMWIGTGGLSDHWGLAHEFMHGVQAVQGGQSCGRSNTCGWVHESHANWAPQQMVEFHTKELHCSEMLANAPHVYLGSTRDRYCNWQFMEFLKDKYCFSAVNAIWTGSPVADPFTAILNGMSWNVSQLNDFIGEWAMHNVIWDYQDPEPQSTAGGNQGKLYRSKYGLITDRSRNERKLRLTKVEPLDKDVATHRRFASPYYWAPQRFGYNVVRLYPESGANSVTVTFRGVTSALASPDWRWGLVATDAALTKARYSPLQKGADGKLSLCVNNGESLWLVVAATPSTLQTILWDQAYGTVPRYPWMVALLGAWPEGFQDGKEDACPSGTVRVANGGGCGPAGLASTVYVGPYALVTGTGVTGSARIEDQAQVLGGKVSDATVGALTVFGSGFSVTGSSTKAHTTFYPLDYFEGRSLVGGSLVGDVELRGNHSSGICSGFVDGSTCVNPGTDATPKPPYSWR